MNKDILSDPEQVAELWQTLHRAARYRGATAAEADDIVQNSFVKALESPPTYRDRLAPWMRTVAERFTLRSKRTKRNRSHREQVAARREPVPSVLELLEEEDHRVTLRAIVDNLSAPYGEVVRMRYFDGLSVGEIASKLDRTPTSVRKQISRGMRLLRERFQPRPQWHQRIPFLFWFRPKPGKALPSLGVFAAISATLLFSLWLALSLGTNEIEAAAPSSAKAELKVASVPKAASTPLAERESLNSAATELVVASAPAPYSVLVLAHRWPVADAEIRVSSKDQTEPGILLGKTNKEGRLQLDGLGAEAWISASRDRMFPSNRFLLRGLGGTRELIIKLTPAAGVLSGDVRSSDGTALAGAKVTLSVSSDNRGRIRAHGTSHLSSQPSSRVAETDKDGYFEVSKIRGQRYDLCIEAQGYAPLLKQLDSPTKEDRHVECVMPIGAALTGVVQDSNETPIPGAEVFLKLAKPLPPRTTTTDAFGRYSFTELPAGPVEIHAFETSSVTPESTLTAMQLSEGDQHSAKLILSREFTLAGVALDAVEGALEGWTVELAPATKRLSANALRRVQTDPAGKFAFAACKQDRTYHLRLYPPGSDFRVPDAVLMNTRAGTLSVTLLRTSETYPTARFSGQVNTSTRNRPALVVIASDILADELYLDIDPDSGLFASHALPPGKYHLRASTPERGFGESLEVELEAGEQKAIELTRAKGVRLIRFNLPQWSGNPSERYAPPVIVIQGEGDTHRIPLPSTGTTAPTDLDHGDYKFTIKRVLGWADATGTFVVSDDSPELITIDLRPGRRVQLRVSAPRPLFGEEQAQLFVHTPQGVQEIYGTRSLSRQDTQAVWELDIGVPHDCMKMQVTTNLGLYGECEINLSTLEDDEELLIALEEE